MDDKTVHKKLKSFSKLSYEKRIKTLCDLNILSKKEALFLKEGRLKQDLSESFIENSIGYYPIPLGIVPYFKMNEKIYSIPMAIEETSVIASLSKMSKWIFNEGEIKAEVLGSLATGQIEFPSVKNFEKLNKLISENKKNFINELNEGVALSLFKRGGGLKKMHLRKLKKRAVLHVFIDPCDSMGANRINQVLEALKKILKEKTDEKISLCILSNLTDEALVSSQISLFNQDEDLCEKIQEASYFAEEDPYRAATSNKGVLNGIGALVLATGNDWRAVEAAAHSYASKNTYTSLTKWRKEGKNLIGQIKLPIPLGIVGGVTKAHPSAQLNLKILKVKSKNELACLCASIGLSQNLGALKALCTKGISFGHMKLHLSNLVLEAGAKEEEKEALHKELKDFFEKNSFVSKTQASEFLEKLRKKK